MTNKFVLVGVGILIGIVAGPKLKTLPLLSKLPSAG